jgi:hypothetical protein
LRKKIPEQAEKKPRTPSKNETLLFLLLLGEVSEELVALLQDPLLSPLAGSLGLGTLGIHLLLEDALTSLLGLGLVDLYPLSALVPRQGISSMSGKRTCSTRARLCLKALPLLEWYSSW